jgi:dTDP-glucose pyrophosphorylase
MKILIPMAGEGTRFKTQGYSLPKPFINVDGKPMIQRVVENLHFNAEYIFLVRKEHLEKNKNFENILRECTNNNYKIVIVDKLTEGAACTALLAKEFINNDEELLIANSDQIMDYKKEDFISNKNNLKTDGIIFCFNDTDPKWSFIKIDDNKNVVEVAEKKPISNIATCGIYWYQKGKNFVQYAEKMIEKNVRVNGEFYIAPVYNELISDGKILVPFYVNKMHGIGTPEDLEKYLNETHKS